MPCCAGGISRTQSPTRSASETSRCKGCKATATRSSTTRTGSSESPSRPTRLPLPPLPRARPLLRLRPHRRLRLRHRQRRACLGSMGLRAAQTKTVRASPTACGAPAPASAQTCRCRLPSECLEEGAGLAGFGHFGVCDSDNFLAATRRGQQPSSEETVCVVANNSIRPTVSCNCAESVSPRYWCAPYTRD